MVVVVICGLLLAMIVPTCNKISTLDHDQREEYRVWCKIYQRDDLSFGDWKIAKDHGMLNAPPAQSGSK